MVKIAGIDGSPRKDSVSSLLVDMALQEAQKEGATIEKIKLVEYDIKPCMGCVSYQGTCNLEHCLEQDGEEVVPLLKRLLEFDGIVFG
ncbi:MAG: flavodoxin family protein, partial [Nitrospirae bacterium]